jgi:hypothetical protein
MHSTRISLVLAAVAAIADTAAGQSFLHLPASQAPATQELGTFRIVPLGRASARVQMFYDAAETGAAAFTATRLALRYDGPIPAVGAPGPFSIQRVEIRAGVTAVAIPGADFAANLSQPLTTVFDAPISYFPDQGTSSPERWGGPNDTLRFQFTQPLPVAIPAGGFFVIDLRIIGNDINGQAHSFLDAARGSGGAVDGMAFSAGTGCSATQGGLPASILTSGVHAPGGVHSIHGTNLGANAPVIPFLGVSDVSAPFGPLPLPLPGTSCQLYTSSDLMLPALLADGSGTLRAFANGSGVAIPALAALRNVPLFEQLVSFVPRANPYNLVFSDKRSIVLGTLVPPNPGFYAVAHGFDANSPVADEAAPFGYAVRLEVQ